MLDEKDSCHEAPGAIIRSLAGRDIELGRSELAGNDGLIGNGGMDRRNRLVEEAGCAGVGLGVVSIMVLNLFEMFEKWSISRLVIHESGWENGLWNRFNGLSTEEYELPDVYVLCTITVGHSALTSDRIFALCTL